MTVWLLAPVVFAAFLTGSALGFGSTLVAVTLGVFLCPLEDLLPAFVPLNVVLSIYLVGRYRRSIEWRLLLRRVIPLTGLGLPVGMLLFHAGSSRALVTVFGAFVVVLCAAELLALHTARSRRRTPLPWPAQVALLVAGGVVHGAYVTGGPMVVYVVGREIADKGVFRSTLSTLWLVLNVVLVAGYAVAGDLDAESGRLTAALVLPLVAGLVAGEWLHGRVNQNLFRALVFGFLFVAGALLLVKG